MWKTIIACLSSPLLLVSCMKVNVSNRLPYRDDVANQVFVEVNSYRESQGKQELSRHGGLDQLAKQHSEFLLRNRGKFNLYGKNVSHEGFEARVLAGKRYYQLESISENVASARVSGPAAGKGLLRLWRNAEAHHHNLLEDWTCTGIGTARDSDGTVFCTQLFATPQIGLNRFNERLTLRY